MVVNFQFSTKLYLYMNFLFYVVYLHDFLWKILISLFWFILGESLSSFEVFNFFSSIKCILYYILFHCIFLNSRFSSYFLLHHITYNTEKKESLLRNLCWRPFFYSKRFFSLILIFPLTTFNYFHLLIYSISFSLFSLCCYYYLSSFQYNKQNFNKYGKKWSVNKNFYDNYMK